MRVLVTAASRHGATHEIAEAIASGLARLPKPPGRPARWPVMTPRARHCRCTSRVSW